MSEKEFLEFCDEDTRAEFLDGEVIVDSPVSRKHADLSRFFVIIVGLFVDSNKLGKIYNGNFQVRLRPGLRRVPDLVFVANDNDVQITDTEIDGAPDLIVEIVSPESLERDWRDKYFEYQNAGVKEYWIVDDHNRRFEIYCLDAKGKYEPQPVENNVVKSKVLPGFWLKADWLWQQELPDVITVAKELKLSI